MGYIRIRRTHTETRESREIKIKSKERERCTKHSDDEEILGRMYTRAERRVFFFFGPVAREEDSGMNTVK